MPGRVCTDSSFVLSLLLRESLTPIAEALWRGWVEQGIQISAPPLFFAEVTSVLREKVYLGHISPEEGEEVFAAFLQLGVGSIDQANLQADAWAMAKAHDRPRAYDAQYLALAAKLGCDLWTGDRRLANAIGVPWVKWLGDYVQGSP